MGAVVVSTRRVMHLVKHDPETDQVHFVRRSDEPYVAESRLTLNNTDWDALGAPEVVTVSIEPGDKLNG